MPPGTLWIWWIAAALLALLGLGGLGVALFRDRSGGKLRCPKCWYSMEGVPTDTDERQRHRVCCPECGRITIGTRKLRKTRRRWRWAAVSLVPLAGAWVSWVMPRAVLHGWQATVPSSIILVAPLDVVGPALDRLSADDTIPRRLAITTLLHNELQQRIDADELSDLHQSLYGWRLRRAAARHAPGNIPSSAHDTFARIRRATIELPPGLNSIEQLARQIHRQTGIPCRVIPLPDLWATADEPTNLSGRRSLLSILADPDETLRPSYRLSQFLGWTINVDGMVLGDVDQLYTDSAFVTACVYDLRPLQRVLGYVRGQREDTALWTWPLSEQYEFINDARMLISKFQWIEGGGLCTTIRSGPWLVVYGPVSIQLQLRAHFDSLMCTSFSSSVFPDTPELLPPSVSAAEKRLIVYNLSQLLSVDLADRQQLARRFAGTGEPRPQTSPFFQSLDESSFLQPDLQDDIDTLTELVWLSVDPDNWDTRSGDGIWDFGSRVCVFQSLSNHAKIEALWRSLAAPDGTPHPAWQTESGDDMYWAVYDTMPLWAAAFARANPETTLEDAAWNFESGLRVVWEKHFLWPGNSPPYSPDPPLFVSLPGRLALLGTESQHTRFAEWLDDAARSDLIVDLLVDPDDNW